MFQTTNQLFMALYGYIFGERISDLHQPPAAALPRAHVRRRHLPGNEGPGANQNPQKTHETMGKPSENGDWTTINGDFMNFMVILCGLTMG